MSRSKKPDWEKLASEFEEGLRRDLGGARVRVRGMTQLPSVLSKSLDSSLFHMGAVGLPREPLLVVVEVARNRPRPSAHDIGDRLKLDQPLDIYYVVPWKHWAALRPRELNPDDRYRGAEDLLILWNLQPDYALVLSAEDPPEWSRKAKKTVEWVA